MSGQPFDAGAHYAQQRAALTTLFEGLDDDELATVVPGCPQWCVLDVLRHLAGITTDIAQGVLEGAGGEAWTAKQVADRQGVGRGALLQEWAAGAPLVEEQAGSWGSTGLRLALDVTVHGDDVREALGLPLGATPAHVAVLDVLVARARGAVVGAGLPAVRLRSATRDELLGDGSAKEAAATLTVDSDGELARVLVSRRSAAQVRALPWVGDPTPYLAVLPLFGPAT